MNNSCSLHLWEPTIHAANLRILLLHRKDILHASGLHVFSTERRGTCGATLYLRTVCSLKPIIDAASSAAAALLHFWRSMKLFMITKDIILRVCVGRVSTKSSKHSCSSKSIRKAKPRSTRNGGTFAAAPKYS